MKKALRRTRKIKHCILCGRFTGGSICKDGLCKPLRGVRDLIPVVSPALPFIEPVLKKLAAQEHSKKHNTLDHQVGGDHYQKMGVQPWEIVEKNKLDFFEGSAVAYILRWKEKGGLTDLKKVIHYMEHMIALAESGHYGKQFKKEDAS
jgi:hypothetical protein